MSDTQVLEAKAREIRVGIAEMVGHLGSGHLGGSLSIVELLSVLYFDLMNVDPQNPKMEDRDYLVLSKGHAGPALYATLAARGFFAHDWLFTLNQPGTRLPSHADRVRTPGVDMSTGSLGQGLSVAAGMAAGLRLKGLGSKVYCIIGDGEQQEGQIWEAAMFAAGNKLDNLILIIDNNRIQSAKYTKDVIPVEPIIDKWQAFGWDTLETDGHDVNALKETLQQAIASQGKPIVVVMHTIKGKGFSACEENLDAHNMPFSAAQAKQAIAEVMADAPA